MSTSARLTGQVKWFNTKAGYGFITVCDGEHQNKDIFVHYTSIKVANPQYLYLVQGEYVDFDIVKPAKDKYEFHAVNITGVKGGSIMCETRKASNDYQPPRKSKSQKSDASPAPVEDVSPDADVPVAADGFTQVKTKRAPRAKVEGSAKPPRAPRAKKAPSA